MLSRMYLWKLVGHDTSQESAFSGIGRDLGPIMRAAELLLKEQLGFACLIVEAVPRMSVFHLEPVQVPTGREWLGRRNTGDGVYWEQKYRPVDPDVAYSLAPSNDLSAIAGLTSPRR
jgi:hypothetical protein